MASGKDFVADKIKNKKVFIVSKAFCPYCTKAKVSYLLDFFFLLEFDFVVLPSPQKVLQNYKIKDDALEILEIENRDDCDEIQNYMRSVTGARSVS